MSSSTWDTELINARNARIVERFTYLYEVKRKRFDDTMYQLKWEEFFLTERTLKELLRKGGVNIPYQVQFKSKHPLGLSLHEARNNKLVERFNYHTNEKRMRIDDALHLLGTKEFYLRVSSVESIVFNWKPITEPKRPNTLFD